MAKKGKDDGDDLGVVKEYLQFEIDNLENLIFLEQDKEKSASDQLDKIIQQQKDHTVSINNLSLSEGKKSISENNNIDSITSSFMIQESNLIKEICDLEEEIKEKKAEILDLKKKNIEELNGKDESIAQQKKQLLETSNSFRDFLLKSCNNLQDGFSVKK